MTTNRVCRYCESHYTYYAFVEGVYYCHSCGHRWGGSIEGKDLSKAWFELNCIRFLGTEVEEDHAFRIAFDHLEAIAKALKSNPKLKRDPGALYTPKLPNDCRWWIENRNDIENKLLTIEAPQHLPSPGKILCNQTFPES